MVWTFRTISDTLPEELLHTAKLFVGKEPGTREQELGGLARDSVIFMSIPPPQRVAVVAEVIASGDRDSDHRALRDQAQAARSQA